MTQRAAWEAMLRGAARAAVTQRAALEAVLLGAAGAAVTQRAAWEAVLLGVAGPAVTQRAAWGAGVLGAVVRARLLSRRMIRRSMNPPGYVRSAPRFLPLSQSKPLCFRVVGRPDPNTIPFNHNILQYVSIQLKIDFH